MSGRSLRYQDSSGKRVTDPATLGRIKKLAIPPAWTDVWICPRDDGHIQATGRDARGRKQYRYHADWRAVRDETKYERMIAFGKALPRIRRHHARSSAVQQPVPVQRLEPSLHDDRVGNPGASGPGLDLRGHRVLRAGLLAIELASPELPSARKRNQHQFHSGPDSATPLVGWRG